MHVVNLTPHAVVYQHGNASVTFPASGTVARVTDTRASLGNVALSAGGEYRLARIAPGVVTDLPEPRPGYRYIVSRIVAAAVKDAAAEYSRFAASGIVSESSRPRGYDDLIFPDDFVRDNSGNILACGMFCCL